MAIDQHGDAKLDGVSIRSLPKVSLHDHLDGALRPQTIIELADEIDLDVPEGDADDLADWFEDQSDSGSLGEYLKTFDLTTAVMQSAEGLRRVAREFVEDLAADGVIYGEVRWAPEQHLGGGLSLEEAVEEPGADVPVTDAELVRKYRPAALATVTVAASATAAKRLSCTHRATRFAVAFDAIVDWVQPCNTYGGASSESKSHVCIGHSGGATRRRLASV